MKKTVEDSARRLFEGMDGLIGDLAGRKAAVPNEERYIECGKVLLFKFGRAVGTFRAIRVLCDSAYSREAIVLIRVLLEALVDIAYLARFPEKAKAFLEHQIVHEKQMQERVKKYGGESAIIMALLRSRADSEKLARAYQAIKHRYPKKTQWEAVSLRSRAEMTGDPNIVAYMDLLYPLASGFIHAKSHVLTDYMFSDAPAGTDIGFSYSSDPEDKVYAIRWATSLMLYILHILNGLFLMGLDDKIMGLHEEERRLAKASFEFLETRFGQASGDPRGQESEDSARGV